MSVGVLTHTVQVLRPAKLWCDTESASEAKELSDRFNFTLVCSPCMTHGSGHSICSIAYSAQLPLPLLHAVHPCRT